LAAADSLIEEDRDRNMVVTTTIRAATAMAMALPIFGRDCSKAANCPCFLAAARKTSAAEQVPSRSWQELRVA
jgi:hypothetical protein